MARPQTNYICREYPAEKTGRNNSYPSSTSNIETSQLKAKGTCNLLDPGQKSRQKNAWVVLRKKAIPALNRSTWSRPGSHFLMTLPKNLGSRHGQTLPFKRGKGPPPQFGMGNLLILVVPRKRWRKVPRQETKGEVSCCDAWTDWWTERWFDLCFLEWLQCHLTHTCWMQYGIV